MDNVRDDTPDVMVPLCIVHQAVLGSTLAVGDVGLEDASTTLTTCPDNATHLCQNGIREKSVREKPTAATTNLIAKFKCKS